MDGYPATREAGAVDALPANPAASFRDFLNSVGLDGDGSQGPGPMDADSFVKIATAADSPFAGLSKDRMLTLADVFAENVSIVGSISGLRYRGTMHFFLATEGREAGSADPQAWQEYIDGPIIVQAVPSTHGAMVSANSLKLIGPIVAASIDS